MDDKKTITITIEEYNLLLENQKQVDELNDLKFTKEHCDLYKENKWLKECLQQAVKDTAKEIIKILRDVRQRYVKSQWREGWDRAIDVACEEIAKSKGVEVE